MARPNCSAKYVVSVDYGKDFATMISNGQYQYVSDEITAENFPIVGHGLNEITLFLIHFARQIDTKEAEAELAKIGLLPATFEQLLAFGSTYPDIQREFTVIALGSSYRRKHGIVNPNLNRKEGGKKRCLLLGWSDTPWGANSRFLAFEIGNQG